MIRVIWNWPISSQTSSNENNLGLWTRGLLIRHNIADGDLAYFTTWCPAGTPIDTLVSVEGRRWATEDSFETAKSEFVLDHKRPDPGMAGIATSRSSCLPSPWWRPSIIRPTS